MNTNRWSRGRVQTFLRKKFPRRLRQFRDEIAYWRATSAELRRVLHDKTTPRGVKRHVYAMLVVRRDA